MCSCAKSSRLTYLPIKYICSQFNSNWSGSAEEYIWLMPATNVYPWLKQEKKDDGTRLSLHFRSKCCRHWCVHSFSVRSFLHLLCSKSNEKEWCLSRRVERHCTYNFRWRQPTLLRDIISWCERRSQIELGKEYRSCTELSSIRRAAGTSRSRNGCW